jgi:hypothetical protein
MSLSYLLGSTFELFCLIDLTVYHVAVSKCLIYFARTLHSNILSDEAPFLHFFLNFFLPSLYLNILMPSSLILEWSMFYLPLLYLVDEEESTT